MEIVFLQGAAQYLLAVSVTSEKEQIHRYLDRQEELAYRVKEPVSKSLGGGIYELRPGPHRLLFIYHARKIVVLHGFRKRTQRTPRREWLAADRARTEYLRGTT